jgi:hypothetical protein
VRKGYKGYTRIFFFFLGFGLLWEKEMSIHDGDEREVRGKSAMSDLERKPDKKRGSPSQVGKLVLVS